MRQVNGAMKRAREMERGVQVCECVGPLSLWRTPRESSRVVSCQWTYETQQELGSTWLLVKLLPTTSALLLWLHIVASTVRIHSASWDVWLRADGALLGTRRVVRVCI